MIVNLPTDLIETIFIKLIDGDRWNDVYNFSIVCKKLNDGLNEVKNNQRKFECDVKIYGNDCIKMVNDNRFDIIFFKMKIDKFDRNIIMMTIDNLINENQILKLFDMEFYDEKYDVDWAASKNYGQLVKYLHKKSKLVTMCAMDSAAEFGNIEVLKYLHENCKSRCTNLAAIKAIKNDNLEVIKFLHDNKYTINFWAVDTAIYYEKFEIIKYLHKNGYRGSDKSIKWALEKNYTYILKYLRNES